MLFLMPFTTIRRYKDCISGNRRRRLTEGERGKKKGRRREKKRGPDPHFSPQSSTFDQTLLYCHLIYFFHLFYLFYLFYLSYLSHSIFPSSNTSSPQIHPPHRDEGQKKKKEPYEQFAASVSARPSVGRPKKIHPLLLTRQGFDCRKIHYLVNAEKKRKKTKKTGEYLVTFTPPHQLSILIPSLTHSIGFVTALETRKKKEKKRQLVMSLFSLSLFV